MVMEKTYTHYLLVDCDDETDILAWFILEDEQQARDWARTTGHSLRTGTWNGKSFELGEEV